MLVRVKQHKTSKIGGISLIAVTKYIIASTIVFSFVVALIFWILEHQNDKHASRKLSFAHSTRHKADWQSKKYSRASFSFIYIYIYGICGISGHNRKTCPRRDSQSSTRYVFFTCMLICHYVEYDRNVYMLQV